MGSARSKGFLVASVPTKLGEARRPLGDNALGRPGHVDGDTAKSAHSASIPDSPRSRR